VTGYYVQMRYPHDPAWVTIEATEHRSAAATLAGEAFRHLTNSRGQGATQVRVISTPDLVRKGGHDAVNHAALDLWHHHKPLGAEGG
jgi:hypothetical protein